MAEAATSPVARALGRIPSGLFIVATRHEGRPVGFLGSFVMQTGFDPPTVCVAVGKRRPHLEAIRAEGRFSLSVLDAGCRGAMTPFVRKLPEGVSPFDDLQVEATGSGTPVLADCLAWVDCRLSGEHDSGDHVVLFGEVVEGRLLREAEPTVHVRKNGLGY